MLLFLPPELKRDPAYPKGSKRSVLMRSSLTAAKCPGKFTQPGVHYGTSPTAIGWPVPLSPRQPAVILGLPEDQNAISGV
jgi:hypothetical protein